MDLTTWDTFSSLDSSFLENVKLAITVGCIDVSMPQVAGVMVTKDDQVYTIGRNLHGILGFHNVGDTTVPLKVDSMCGRQVENLYVGFSHVVALTSKGKLFTWGDNEFCQLGIGKLKERSCSTPTMVAGELEDKCVKSLACGFNHSLALTDEGEVFVWGFNKDGRVGTLANRTIGEYNLVDTPAKLELPNQDGKIVAIGCGRQFSVVLTEAGHVYCWGSNKHGQLGRSLEMVDSSVPLRLKTSMTFKHIVCGPFHTLALTEDGKCYFWGRDSETCITEPRQMGQRIEDIVEIAATCLVHMSAIRSTEGIYVWAHPTMLQGRYLPTPYLTNLSSTDLAFAFWSEPSVMWRALTSNNLVPLRTTSSSSTSRDALVEIAGKFPMKNGIRIIPPEFLKFTEQEDDTVNPVEEGKSSLVYRGKLKGPEHDVAFKVIRSNGTNWVKSLKSELKTLAAIGKHDHILYFVGLSKLECPKPLPKDLCNYVIVTEYCHHLDLRNFLMRRRDYFVDQLVDDRIVVQPPTSNEPYSPYVKYSTTDGSVTTTDLVRWAAQLASAMDFLASRNIVHGDLAARNVLLDGNKNVKLCDFNLSRRIEGRDYYRMVHPNYIPWSSAAPETLEKHILSTYSDVWGFGVTLWEMFSLGGIPYEDTHAALTEQFRNALSEGFRLSRPKFASTSIYSVMQSCWELDPARRPTFRRLNKIFLSYCQDNNS